MKPEQEILTGLLEAEYRAQKNLDQIQGLLEKALSFGWSLTIMERPDNVIPIRRPHDDRALHPSQDPPTDGA